jgi:putative oxygen-independent coproporphyrinogen III oxidase
MPSVTVPMLGASCSPAALPEAGSADPGFGIYIHWPFCLSKCPYCDFNSHVREGVDQQQWQAALLAELDHYRADSAGRTVTSIFFGGGTPSLMQPATVGAVLDGIAARWPVVGDVEITLEANPTSVEAGHFAGYRAAGVNRVSLGVQALSDTDLKALGRTHDQAQALDAIALAARSFDRYSFDLIYARPGQTVAAWAEELDRAIALSGGHLSVYQLTIEVGTTFEALHRRGLLTVPDEDLGAALWEETQARLEAAGLPGYEISNHAVPGQECRHNLLYWRYGDYLGIGPGAHGRLTLQGQKFATRQHRAPEIWLQRVQRDGHATTHRDIVPPADRRAELLMMGLRPRDGLTRERVRAELGAEIEAVVDPAGLAELLAGGFVSLDTQGLRCTPRGHPVLNAVLAKLI